MSILKDFYKNVRENIEAAICAAISGCVIIATMIFIPPIGIGFAVFIAFCAFVTSVARILGI